MQAWGLVSYTEMFQGFYTKWGLFVSPSQRRDQRGSDKKPNKTKHEDIAAPLKGCVAMYPNHKASLLQLAPVALCSVLTVSAVG